MLSMGSVFTNDFGMVPGFDLRKANFSLLGVMEKAL
jgi:hypothetical protein